MIKIRFYLKKPKLTASPILISVSWQGNRLILPLHISINPQHWDFKYQKIKTSVSYSQEINRLLNKIADDTETSFMQMLPDTLYPSFSDVKNMLLRILRNKSKDDIIELFDVFLEKRQTAGEIKQSTVTKYLSVQNLIISYQVLQKKQLLIAHVNDRYIHSFFEYLLSNNQQNQSALHTLTIVRIFLNWAKDNGYIINDDALKAIRNIRKTFNNTDNEYLIALTEIELSQIEEYRPVKPNLIIAKTMFLLQCYTGMRFSDLLKLTVFNINQADNTLRLTTKKTDKSINIPIHDKLKAVLDMFFGFTKITKLPNVYNKAIKQLAALSGINSDVICIEYRKKNRIEVIKKKFELVSSHTARRTFITLSLKRGALAEDIMNITGHRSRTTFEKYVRFASQESVEIIRHIWNKKSLPESEGSAV